MKLYGCHNTRSLRAAWALEEVGAPFDYVFVDLLKGEGRREAFLAINPAGKVPVLVDGDLVLTESGAIVTYVGERYPASLLAPADVRERADYLRWCFFIETELEQPLWTIAKHRFALPKERRIAGVEQTAAWEFEAAAALLDRGLGDRDALVAGRFSAADILAAHTLAWARSMKFALPARLESYCTRQLARPATQRAVAREKAAAEAARTTDPARS